ncbi:GNAT family N-acetyltransferase [Rugamonas sp. CCM 8940]|uniref:GNAT family N-acetyltransferase n=1 Tax=Rugamonas sp. CCM 8940 TaxID=2765359 RepID=UPI0018F7AB02|nr:GNAT family N-acetyltransferase [Rugamonas sp. CCM 8940]MBJ7310886.1 GNAT family N-acetyltransferase [Rugamonas sp. CCM 8940]
MSHPNLQFLPLPSALSGKALLAWRKDAGWASPASRDEPLHPNGKVQWVSVVAGKQRAGIARLELAPPEFCYVADLIIASKFRQRGIGSWFLGAIEQFVHSHGIKRLLLRPEAGTEAFYTARQFISDPYVPTFLKKDLPPLQRKLFIGRPT